jgi:ketosteroid isomerase-like protein
MMLGVAVEDEVRAANGAFYSAFESGDLDAMAEVWERSDRARVTHPGWATLYGWAKVVASWEAIFANTEFIQFVLTEERILVLDTVALVTLDENILQSAGTPEGGGTDTEELSGARVAATNVFSYDGARWRMVHHHGSPVSPDAV